MEVNNNCVVIDVSLTDGIFKQLTFLLTGLVDISLKVENSVITTKNIDLPDAVSSVEFKNCTFKVPTIISNLKDGRLFRIENCKRDFLLGNVNLKAIHCSSMIIDQGEIQDFFECLSPDINKCLIEYLDCKSEQLPVFTDVLFVKKIFISTRIKSEPCSLFFNACTFFKSVELNINIKSPLLINMDECGFVKSKTDSDSDSDSDLALVRFSENSIVKSLKISKSKIGKMKFNLFSVTIENIIISESEVGALDLSTIEKKEKDDEEHNSIYNLSMTESFLKSLNLKHRKIIHEIDFSNTFFSTPPRIQGANIPEGSEIPDKSHFISRKGIHDASCYRALRFIMESQRNRELEGMFFSLEQESLLNDKGTIKKYFSANYLYFLLSDYGTNYRTPICILLITIPIFTIIYSIIKSPVISTSLPIDWDIVIKSLIVTLKQTFLPFDVLRNNDFVAGKTAGSGMGFVLVGIVNSILSVSLLALSGLALRWKFKRG
ncbi:hypothetical protein LAW23_22115 [Escherichia coli]|uniref:hypothetical protein n=1 Tax=Escherichia coli TaxID=562 RepID=UPI000D01D4C8|nr:hypothetical protein [Escherichia coli]EGI4244177.1 hypothetical protein [Escherichia coli]EKV2260762.1 hypothetical protein [Escherichia coli]MDD8381716.1 hypothetical protein [Escherichia coli]MED8157555.1 hypothetical protein [Escherichia coli]MQJ00625.1 hypothetical protein [Escherichia coli]